MQSHVVAIGILQSLGFVKGAVFELTPKDYEFKFPANKKPAAIMGMAADNHVRALISKKMSPDVTFSSYQFAPFDFRAGDAFIDIKTHTAKSVSISDNEIRFAEQQLAKGYYVYYMVFEQIKDDLDAYGSIRFDGYVSLENLIAGTKILDSQYQGVYFSLRDKFVKEEMMFE